MKNQILTFGVLLITSSVFSQGIQFADGTSTTMDQTFVTLGNNDDIDIQGSKYLDDDFKNAKISSFPDQIFGVRFNVYGEEMEVQGAEDKIFALNKIDDEVSVTFINTGMTYFLYDYSDDNGATKRGYFTRVNPSGDAVILKKEGVIFLEEKPSKTGYDAYRPPMFKKTKPKTYIKTAGKNAVVIPTKRSKLAKLFKDSTVIDYINKEKIKPSKDSDLLKFINFVNEL